MLDNVEDIFGTQFPHKGSRVKDLGKSRRLQFLLKKNQKMNLKSDIFYEKRVFEFVTILLKINYSRASLFLVLTDRYSIRGSSCSSPV